MTERLTKPQRLRAPQIFRDLLSTRDKISTPYFSIRYKSNFLAVSRLGVALPKKKFRARSTVIA